MLLKAHDINNFVRCLLPTFVQLKLQLIKTLVVNKADDPISKGIFPQFKHPS